MPWSISRLAYSPFCVCMEPSFVRGGCQLHTISMLHALKAEATAQDRDDVEPTASTSSPALGKLQLYRLHSCNAQYSLATCQEKWHQTSSQVAIHCLTKAR